MTAQPHKVGVVSGYITSSDYSINQSATICTDNQFESYSQFPALVGSSCMCSPTSFIGTLPKVSIAGTTSTDTSIIVSIGTIPNGTDRVIMGYHRLDLGVPVVGEYVNYRKRSRTFSSLVPGAKYRITAWGLGGSGDRRRSQSPAVREVTTMEKGE